MPPLGVSNSLKIFKNGLEMRKLCATPPPPPQRRSRTEKKKPTKHYKAGF
jgi:hypothetical protein